MQLGWSRLVLFCLHELCGALCWGAGNRLRNAPALGVFLRSIAVEEIGKLPERVPFSRPTKNL